MKRFEMAIWFTRGAS